MAIFPVVGASRRVDVFLAENIPGWSRRLAQQALAAGVVARRRDGEPARRIRKGELLQAGDEIDVADSWMEPQQLAPNPDLPIAVVHEDDHLLIVDKPAGIPSVALRRSETDTVANFVLSRCTDASVLGGSSLEAGLVHRLDTNTSGMLLAAKNRTAYDFLRAQFGANEVAKHYLAVVHGEVETAGVIDNPIAHSRRANRMTVVAEARAGRRALVEKARRAVTWYRPIRVLPCSPNEASGHPEGSRAGSMQTLLRVRIETGVMHQIRVHMASLGHPVIGDQLYGSTQELPGGRHLLHAVRLTFIHPATGKATEFTRSAPDDFGVFAGAGVEP